jgi:two-component system chemotaxis sensor kinase CheA
MGAELDMSQYLDLFLQEAEEQLEILEQETLRLETDPTPERLSAIFRAAHTLKGSSRAMGFSNFAGVTHEMENILDALRAGQLQITTEMGDVLLKGIDALGSLKASIANGDGDVGDVQELIKKLQAFLMAEAHEVSSSAPVATSTVSSERPRLELASEIIDNLKIAASEKAVLCARFSLTADCAMKFARAFMAISIVTDGGELLASIPAPEALEEEAFETDFDLYFHHPSDIELLRKRFGAISEVKQFEVVPYLAKIVKADIPVEKVAGDPPAVADSVAAPKKKMEASQTVRVEVTRLDELMNLVGELVIDRTRIAEIGGILSAKYDSDANVEALSETVTHISRITADLQDQLMKARMLPIETVFNRFPRMVRDLAQKCGKDVRLEVIGGETELDRSVIEVIGDPLIHVLRNSIDHGLEDPEARVKAGKSKTGLVQLTARHKDNYIVIEIRDDGKGIDLDRVKAKAVSAGLVTAEAAAKLTPKEVTNFIFESGLSTAAAVSEVSGRGVGMDIVRSNILKLGGLIDVETTPGQGTVFTLRLPLTLAIIRGLLVRARGMVYVLPLGSVVETLRISKSEVQTVRQRQVVVIRGATTVLVHLNSIFDVGDEVAEESDSLYVVVVGLAEQRIGLVVDGLVGEHEVVIKSLSRHCGDVTGISGATILGNGRVALIVDVNGLLVGERK